ncbi:hypothetical protein E2C01_081653 [Portunus trituberculatus]|uniref:Uncharacterized protein n=1 Tax=Portunus trituberculatus TaxID=210409 RepID=A0A5B7IZF3_PORTR|nr:hypothetical protein [Portunus trituberculatus]
MWGPIENPLASQEWVATHTLKNCTLNPSARPFAYDGTLSHSCGREEAVNVIDVTSRQLGDRQWQVKCAAKKIQTLVTSGSREDARLMEGQLKFGEDTLATKGSINILSMSTPCSVLNRHLDSVALLPPVRHLLDTKGNVTLYKAQAYHGVQFPHVIICAQSLFSLVGKVQQRAERLIHCAGDSDSRSDHTQTAIKTPIVAYLTAWNTRDEWTSHIAVQGPGAANTAPHCASDPLKEECRSVRRQRHSGAVEHLHLTSGRHHDIHPADEMHYQRLPSEGRVQNTVPDSDGAKVMKYVPDSDSVGSGGESECLTVTV